MKPFLDNFGRIQEMFGAWWKLENRRPLLHVPVTSDAPPDSRPTFPVDDPAAWYLDADVLFSRVSTGLASRFLGIGEEFPFHCPPFPGPAFFGAEPLFTDQTIWYRPALGDDDPYTALSFDANNPWWRRSLVMLERLAELAQGHFLVSVPTVYSPVDALSSLRGAEGLCLDLKTRPEEVKAGQRAALDGWRAQYDACYAVLRDRFDGCGCGFLDAWSAGSAWSIQCDFSAMISGEMFDEFVVPEVEAQARHVAYSLYHLDGPDAARHADALLRIPELNGIQWQRGANGGPTLRWLPLLKKIQEAGKLIMVDGSPEEVMELGQALQPEGLMLATACPTDAEARDLVRRFDRRFGTGNT